MSFDHRDGGTPEAAWQSLLTRLPFADPPGHDGHLLVLAAHPDDETLGAGGLIALTAASGARVTVVVATDGDASHPQSPTHSAADLAARRRDEVRAAVLILAPAADVHLLGLPDGHVDEHVQDAVDRVLRLVTVQHPPSLVISTWDGDGHPDHHGCAASAAALAQHWGVEHWQYPIWAWHWGEPSRSPLPEDALRAVSLDPPTRARKSAALAEHVSQHTELSPDPRDAPVLGADLLEHFNRRVEVFVVPTRAETEQPGYFDRLYEQDDDPWGLGDRFYERRKRDLLLASLPREQLGRVFEPGCALGLLSVELAARCTELVAWDVAPAAVRQAEERTAQLPDVTVELADITRSWPAGTFDLIVLSEVAYYCTDLARLRRLAHRSLSPQGVLVACHWRHPAAGYPQSAEQVHSTLGAGLHQLLEHVEEDFLLHVWSVDGASVARREGIVP